MRAFFLISLLFPLTTAAESFVNYTHDPLGLYVEAMETNDLNIDETEVLYWVVLKDQIHLIEPDSDSDLQTCFVPTVHGTDPTLKVPWYTYESNGESVVAKKMVIKTKNGPRFYTLEEVNQIATAICFPETAMTI